MLKFEGKFKEGQRIRAYDYNPEKMPEGTHVYAEGVIEKVLGAPQYAYQITCDVCTHMKRTGEPMLVPMEIDSNEFDERIMLAEKQPAD
jgi:hypothetical protein